jgi:hypothetical protein
LPVMMPLAQLETDHLFGILNLSHCDLFAICFFGAWNFHDFL